MIKKDLITHSSQIIELLLTKYQGQGTELNYSNEFELLCAVILSAQTTDKRVNIVTPDLFKNANTPEMMLTLGVGGISQYIKSVGLYQAKANYLYNMSKLLIENFNGQVPNNLEQLLTLPGVGRKTANVILNTLHNKNVIAVDTHVLRVSQRLSLSQGTTPLAVERDLMNNIKPEYIAIAHNLFVLHGRYTCKSQKPNCDSCIIKQLCHYDYNKQSNSSG
jgi:endonuclease-3